MAYGVTSSMADPDFAGIPAIAIACRRIAFAISALRGSSLGDVAKLFHRGEVAMTIAIPASRGFVRGLS
ncbi:hypothetical protein TIFTF001_039020 [Ficus carica]|uniref:Uncharacterized protein n=1 Tax=Ficus carica TaxID=3494 RepID=A0AA88JAK2_FICCA|nr:hypothetical protein TIFTF001_039020 [Ficus carica]